MSTVILKKEFTITKFVRVTVIYLLIQEVQALKVVFTV